MIIGVIRDVSANVWSATITIEFSSYETSFTQAYGEPQVNVGGVLNYYPIITTPPDDAPPNPSPNPEGGEDEPPYTVSVNLGTKLIFMRSSFPYTQSFNATLNADAPRQIECWIADVVANLTAALDTLLALNPPNYPNTTYLNVN